MLYNCQAGLDCRCLPFKGDPPLPSTVLGCVLSIERSIPRSNMAENNTKPRLLIVDDETEVRSVLNDLLGDICQCTQAPSAEEALAQLRERDYQLVISDITMSGMSGLEMIPHVKVIWKNWSNNALPNSTRRWVRWRTLIDRP